MINFAFSWAAREGNTQSKKWEATFFLRYVKKDKMADGTPRRLCVSHSPFNGADFCGEGMGHFRSSGEHIWKSIWNEHKIITWSIWPYIYAEWLLNFFRRVTLREFSVIKARKTLVFARENSLHFKRAKQKTRCFHCTSGLFWLNLAKIFPVKTQLLTVLNQWTFLPIRRPYWINSI